MRCLGLDVSSSIIGVAVAECDETGVVRPTFLEHIRLDNISGLWNKHDEFVRRFNELRAITPELQDVDHVAVEEALLSFRPGASSAETITTLVRINVLVSSTMRSMFRMDPRFIASSSARKLAGVKVQRTAACGKNAKDQVFEHMCKHDLSHVVWPKKRNGNPKDFAKDITDAWVVAKACSLLVQTETHSVA